MSNFDMAAGITQTGLNGILTKLFANSTAQSKIFKGTVSKDVDPLGTVTMNYQVVACPSIDLSPPTKKEWEASYKDKGVTTMPDKNVFQLLLSDVKGDVSYAGETSLKAQGEIKIYGVFAISENRLSLTPLSVWIDESKFSVWDKVIVNNILIPKILEIAKQSLSGIPLPVIPTVAGQKFRDPIADIVNNNELVAATALTSSPAPNLSSYTNPGKDIYALSDLTVINNIIAAEVKGKTESSEDRSGTSGWYAEGKISATVGDIAVKIKNNDTNVSIGLNDISGYGELGGTGVGITKAILCPIGAAADAISNPSDWDKVVSDFSITYKPDPLDVPITLTTNTKDSKQDLEVSVGKIDSVQIIAAPTWSGSVTGSALSAAAAGFVDLLSVIFKGLIVNAILKDHAQNIKIYTIPNISTTVEGITVQLVIPDGTVANAYGSNQIIQNFTVNFPA